MSEENSARTSNLCTTEDAFEQFQAVAMYEEDEFITLSDIVPPQPEVPDLSNELNEIPYDNEVVLGSTSEDAQNINTTVESSFGQNNELGSQYLDETKNNASRTHATSPKPLYFNERKLGTPGVTNSSKKRGRKKTKSFENRFSDQKVVESDGNTLTGNQAIQDSVLSTTVGKNDTESNNVSPRESTYPRRTRRERIPNTAKYPLLTPEIVLNDTISNQITPTKRRGRPKKVPIENSTIPEPDSTNIDNASMVQDNLSCPEISEPDEASIKKTTLRRRRGRPKTSLTQTNVKEMNKSSNETTENNTDMPVRDIQKPTRRGRQKLSEPIEKPSESIGNSDEANVHNTDFQPEDNQLPLNEHVKDHNERNSQIDSNSLDSDTMKKPSKQGKKKKVITKCNDSISEEKMEASFQEPVDNVLEHDDDDADDICLSKLKEQVINDSEDLNDNISDVTVVIQTIPTANDETSKRHSKVPIMADFEYNIDKIGKETYSNGDNEVDTIDNSLLVEDTSKRPYRRKAQQSFKYDEDSDEDPFANIELSDDDEPRNKKKGRYASDDEYVPWKKGRATPEMGSSGSDIEINDDIEDGKKQKRKKKNKNSDNQSPRKRGRKSKAEMSLNEDQKGDIEEPSLVSDEPLSMKPPAEAWATSNEFENFIAQKIGTNLKIKKVSSKQKTENVVTRLEIPVIDQIEQKKLTETSTQTSSTSTTSTGVQTCVPYDIPMKTAVNLTSEQSEKACEFLNSVVKTTAELGQLMKVKSEDFMNKKINTENITDTFKMDYCVRKSFLLFKLAKHNLIQMEEDLAKQYDEFLKNNGLSSCREELKSVTPKLNPKPQKADSDSDCEIVDVKEVPKGSTKKETPKFNPKTVFLNKELSIKIAKKPSADKNIDIKGRHTVWINDSVMVKKVKPTQSFLAQDSRNKKPPDCITEKMVSDFFKDYYHQKAIAVCAPYTNTEWSSVYKEYACHYFVKCKALNESDTKNAADCMNMIGNDASTSNGTDIAGSKETHKNNPKSLVSLCTKVICDFLNYDNTKEANEELLCNLTDGKNKNQPLTLFRLCIQYLPIKLQNNMSKKSTILNQKKQGNKSMTVLPLQTLCFQRIAKLMPLLEKSRNHFKNINGHTVGKDVYRETDTMSNEGTPNNKDVNTHISDEDLSSNTSVCEEKDLLSDESNYCDMIHIHKNGIQSLFSLCAKYIQNIHGGYKKPKSIFVEDIEKIHSKTKIELMRPNLSSPESLKHIVYKCIKHFIYADKLTNCDAIQAEAYQTDEIIHSIENTEDFTINCINTMSEEAFHSLEEPNELQEDFDYEPGIEDFDEDEFDDNEWASQVQMQELRSCVTPVNSIPANEYCDTNIDNSYVASPMNTTENEFINTNIEPDAEYPNTEESIDSLLPTTQIKLEPVDYIQENEDSSIVKTEPVLGLDGMTIIPESIVTKSEIIDHGIEAADLVEKESTSFDVASFEQFVNTSKMRSMDEYSDSEEMFSQSGLRIRRQHEPDCDAENDMNMSLLIPHTFEPLHIESAKGDLMESSSDEGKNSGAKKTGRKKHERKKTKLKKSKENVKNSNSKEIPTKIKDGKDIPCKGISVKEISATLKEKAESLNEVAILTRRMREKIREEEKKIESSDSETENMSLSLRREKNKKETEKICERISQEEKKVESSDSEIENLALSLRRTKNKKETEKNKTNKNLKQGEPSNGKAVADNEIQCNNVDSTEQVLENKSKGIETDQFTGFSAMEQSEISKYEKYLKLVYEKIVPEDIDSTHENASSDFDGDNFESNRSSPLLNPDEPVELLECEPTLPIFDNGHLDKAAKRQHKTVGKKSGSKQSSIEKYKTKFTERHGWHCYSYDRKDVESYKNCHIPLEKLPESFVETYLEYHDITARDNIDKEVDRLINLQSLNRATYSIKEGKSKSRQKGKSSSNEQTTSEQNCRNDSRVPSPANSDRLDELTASEDEDVNVDDELPPPVPMRTTENYIAKNSLMGENESDSDGGGTKKIKDELNDTDQVVVKHKPGPKSKISNKAKADMRPSNEFLMLTADKMMNKELTLLHAPIVLKDEINDAPLKEPSSKEESKYKKRNAKKSSLRYRFKNDDDSSSEEEKQWVSTKEKLLKRVGKKEDICLDDAKRAKLVDDFIERRGDEPGKRRAIGTSGRRSRKKFLERMKQQRVLSKELYGEPDALPGGKRGAAGGLFKGRRNIRKVIDKKSLQKSTVLANMEEFERKRRLNSKQNQLRELLDCEEGVNVLVINDEVCLEYDFREQRPVVTVHPFFTKVMKAHQYEGVKFMWDACFESLEVMEAGRPGGGCILAHCMGLGKTLQVLALLHTVLTHPRSGMTRVLVCCPLSTVLNWVDEIHKWIGPVTDQIKVFELSKLKKTYERAYQLEDWYSGGGIFIIGYELFRSLTTLDPQIDEVRPTIINKIRRALLNPGPDIIVCDEGHLLKNDCSVLAVAMSRVVTRRRIVLTGTPMQNNLREYYCMVNFVKPNLLGTYSEYSNRFENPIMNGQHRDSLTEDIKLMKARTHILHKVLEGCLQRQEASVLYPYLPKKHEYTVFIPLTKCQWDLYKHYVHHYTKKSKQSVLKDFHILQKIWSHPQVLHNFQIKSRVEAKKKEIKPEKLEDDLALEDKEDIKPTDTGVWWLDYLADGAMLNSLESSNKFVAVFRILHECIALGDKVLIFSTSLFCLDALEYFLKQINGWSLGQEYFRLDGSVPPEVRQKWCREYNAESNVKTKLFLISTRAGCLGLNMTAANRVIILDTSWNPAHDIQSIFRVYRFGQKKDCYIYRLVAMGTMEQKIYERSVTKQAVACRVVDEQQIDRHYNMAELTELYRFDEFGSGVAGGVAVGVGDVALLRVARDAAVHAVHEHDSLLRGSGEQGLPEHERAAAWMQFQQEHANKQMQNDLETDRAAQALKKEQELELIRQQLAQKRAQVLKIKTEDRPVHENLLVPMPVQPSPSGRGGWRGGGRGRKIVQCRIPIGQTGAGPSQVLEPPLNEEDMVRKISNILIKHNFTQSRRGPHQIKELVAKVKQMIQTGEPIRLGQSDELTASIANVLLQRQGSAPARMPALTDISPEEPRRSRGRPRKSEQNQPASAPPAAPPVVDEDVEYEVSGRRRRKAAIAAERQFEVSDDGTSQDSVAANAVIELDDDDWQGVGSETDSAPEFANLPEPAQKQKPPEVPKRTARKRITARPNALDKSKQNDTSILLSDDEAPLVVKPQEKPAVETIPLHPSLLSNQNFIKIVAHTYLAGNPMLDEDAATLAAQYSTFKLLKETESTGKPIKSGPIYDIAIKVLGKEVLQKLQTADPITKESGRDLNSASSKLMNLLSKEPAPARRPGPKSRVKQMEIKQEKEMPKLGIPQVVNVPKTSAPIVPVKLLRRVTVAVPAAAPAAAEECILPDDDEDVRCVTDAAPPAPARKLKLRLLPMQKDQDSKPKQTPPQGAIRVIAGGVGSAVAPVFSKTYATISLDSDDDEPAAAPAKPQAGVRSLRAGGAAAPAGGPVPVALTGPNSQPLPLTLGRPAGPASAAPASLPTYSLSSTPSVIYTDPVLPSLAGRDSRPVPISLTGPDSRPVPISLTGPGFQAIPISMAGSGLRGIPASYAVTGAPMSFETGAASYDGDASSCPMTFTVAAPSSGGVRPVAMSYVGAAGPDPTPQPISQPTSDTPGASGVRMVRPSSSGQAGSAGAHGGGGGGGGGGSVMHHVASNIILVPAAAAGDRLLTRVPASLVPLSQRLDASQATKQLNYIPITNPNTACKPGDIVRLTKTGQLEVLRENSADLIHTIDDDEPITQPTPKAPTNAAIPKAQTTNQFAYKSPSLTPIAPKPAPQPVSKPAPKPVTKPASQPVTKPAPQPVTKPAPQPVTKPAPQPVTKSAPQPVTKPAPQPVTKPAPQSVLKPAPQPVTKPAPQPVSQPTPQPVSKSDDSDEGHSHRSRKISSSSSSSSNSSRSPTPDPLSILKDVVHIQAPSRQRSQIMIPIPRKPEIPFPKQHSKANQGSSKVIPSLAKKPTYSSEKTKLNDGALHLKSILARVKSKLSSKTPTATNSKAAVATIKDSIDLTEISFNSFKSGDTLKTYSTPKGKSTSTSKKDCTSTVMGTLKNIVLDVKSKSLTNKSTVDLTGQNSVQVKDVKTITPSTSKQKPPEKKRAAPPVEAAAPKKKKTELLTLKDFDLDDIDDIIELE